MSEGVQPINPQLIALIAQQKNQQREDALRHQGQLLEQAHGIALTGQPVPPDLLQQLGAPDLATAVQSFGDAVRANKKEIQAQELIKQYGAQSAPTINPSGQGFQPPTPEQSQLSSLLQNQVSGLPSNLQQIYGPRLQGEQLGAQTSQQAEIAKEQRTQGYEISKEKREEASKERVIAYQGGVNINVDRAKQALEDQTKTTDAIAQGFSGIASGVIPPEKTQELNGLMANLTPTEQKLVRSRIIGSLASTSDVREVTQSLIDSGVPGVTPAKAKAVIDGKLKPMGELGLVPITDEKSLEQSKSFLDALTALDRIKNVATDIASRGVITRLPGILGTGWQEAQRRFGNQDPAFGDYDFATFALSESLNRALLQGGRVNQPMIERLLKELPSPADLVKANTQTGLSESARRRFESARNFIIDRGKYSGVGNAAVKIPENDKGAAAADAQLRSVMAGGQ